MLIDQINFSVTCTNKDIKVCSSPTIILFSLENNFAIQKRGKFMVLLILADLSLCKLWGKGVTEFGLWTEIKMTLSPPL